MNLFWPLLCGCGIAFVASLPPGLLNMSAVKTYHKISATSAYWFIFGASTVVALEAAIAVYFAKYIEGNPVIIFYLREAAVILFSLLGIYFLCFARKPVKAKPKTTIQQASFHFVRGMLLAGINFLVIPFYVLVGVYLYTTTWFYLEVPYIASLVIGVGIGASLALLLYTQLFKNNSESDSLILRQMNRIIGGILLLIAIITLAQLLQS